MSGYPNNAQVPQGAPGAQMPGMMWGGQCGQMMPGQMAMPQAPGGQQPGMFYGMPQGQQAQPVSPGLMPGGFQMGAAAANPAEAGQAAVPMPGMMWGGGQCPQMMQGCPGQQGMFYGMQQAQQQAQGMNPAMMQGGFQMGWNPAAGQQQAPAPQAQAAQPAADQAPAAVPSQSAMPAPAGALTGVGESFKQCMEGLSRIEKEYYMYLWQEACTNAGSQTLGGKAAFEFLSRSAVSRETLKRIWDLADYQKRHFLTWEEFPVALKLIYAAQKKQLVSLERIHITSPSSMDCPTFEGFDDVKAFLRKHEELQPPAEQNAAPTGGADIFDAFSELAPPPSTTAPTPAMPVAAQEDLASPGLPAQAGTAPGMMPPAEAAAMLFPAGMPGACPAGGMQMGTMPAAAEAPGGAQWSPSFEAAAPAMPGADSGDWGDFASQPGGADVTAPPVPSQSGFSPPAPRAEAAAVPAPAAVPPAPGAFDFDFDTPAATDSAPQTTVQAPPKADGEWSAFGDADEANFAAAPAPVIPQPQETSSARAPTSEEWGAFSDAVPAAASAPQDNDDSWADFAGGPTMEDSAAPAPATGDKWAKMSAFDDLLKEDEVVPPTAEATFQDAFAADAAGFSQPPAPTADDFADNWGDFSAAATEEIGGTKASAAEQTADTDLFGAFDGAATAPATATASGGDDWSGFAGADFGSGGQDSISFPDMSKPATGAPLAAPADDDWGAFASDDFVSNTAAVEMPAAASGPKADGFADFSTSFGDVEPEASPTLAASIPPPDRMQQDSWAAFGADDDFSFASAPPAPVAPLQPEVLTGTTKAMSSTSVPEPLEPEEPTGPETEFQKLARALALLGLFEQAAKCLEHGSKADLLSSAEARKKEAVARDDFEGAIQIRSEIQSLTSSLAPASQVEAWRASAERGEKDESLKPKLQHIRQQCQMMDDAAARKAVAIALGNIGSKQANFRSFRDLPQLVFKRREALVCTRAVEAATSSNPLQFLQVLAVCLDSLASLLASCSDSLAQLSDMNLSAGEKEVVTKAAEFTGLLQGIDTLRRLLWRFTVTAEVFQPAGGRIDGESESDFTEADASKLQRLLDTLAAKLKSATSSWSRAEKLLGALQLGTVWDPKECFEVRSGATVGEDGMGVGTTSASSFPLCVLCMLPASPLASFGATPCSEDTAVSSALWKGGLWHVQCANFWVKHCSNSPLLKEEFRMVNPF